MNSSKMKILILAGGRKTVNPPYGSDHTEDLFMFNFKLAGGEQHFMLFADGKSTRDSRFSGARGVATLTKRSDATFSVKQFSSADGE